MRRPADPAAVGRTVRAGLERASHELPEGRVGHVPRLTMRLRPGASEREIAAAFRAALGPAMPQQDGGGDR